MRQSGCFYPFKSGEPRQGSLFIAEGSSSTHVCRSPLKWDPVILAHCLWGELAGANGVGRVALVVFCGPLKWHAILLAHCLWGQLAGVDGVGRVVVVVC